MGLICISLRLNDCEHLFSCLLAICISLEKFLFSTWLSFKSGCLFFWCWVVVDLCIFWILTSHQLFENIFSPSLEYLFTLLINALMHSFKFRYTGSSIYLFFFHVLTVHLVSWPNQKLWSFPPTFSSKSFIVIALHLHL